MKKGRAVKFLLIVLFTTVFLNHLHSDAPSPSANITIIGTGYVGLISGACLAEFGNKVLCSDIDEEKIAILNQGGLTIFETDLQPLIQSNVQNKRLAFTSNVAQAIQKSEIILVCVGTPMKKTGGLDLSAIYAAAKLIGENLTTPKTIFIKSTVPLGTIRKLQAYIEQHKKNHIHFEIAYLPEFIREGSAVYDFFEPERIVVGTESELARQLSTEIHSPLRKKDIPFLFTSIESAEAIKLVANSYLVAKVSFINEIANLCDHTGADVFEVAKGIGLDSRIGQKFLNPGPGYGGSCFPKDSQALLDSAKHLGVDLKIIQAAVEANDLQPKIILHKLSKMLNSSFEKKTIAVLGLAYKADTDDVRDSPALKIIQELLQMGVHVKAYDPQATSNAKKIFPQLEYCNSSFEAAKQADALMILTEWEEFRQLDWSKIRNLMNQRVILDARNSLSTTLLKELGFKFANIGRSKISEHSFCNNNDSLK